MSGEKERVTRLETRAREAENALQQLRAYIELLRRKASTGESIFFFFFFFFVHALHPVVVCFFLHVLYHPQLNQTLEHLQ